MTSRLIVPALLAPFFLSSAGCRGARESSVDSRAPSDSVQVGTVPAPATSPLADSAAALDRRWQSERAALNSESRALDTLDRRGADYARRFDAWRVRARAADSIRVARDKLRARLTSPQR